MDMIEEKIVLEKFHRDLDAVVELYNDGKISKIEYLKRKAKLALDLTKPKETA